MLSTIERSYFHLKSSVRPGSVLFMLLGFAGCWGSDAPELADVWGTVTLDGKPLPNAALEFQPQDGTGTYSSAMTDENGYYELIYSRTDDGAMIGTHSVSITTSLMLRDRGDGISGRAPELVPPRYNRETELTAVVERGGTEINFDLESGGFPNKQ